MPTAEALVKRIKEKGGRVYTMPSRMVFCLTDSVELRDGLIEMGGRYHAASGVGGERGYKRASEGSALEWDIWIHQIEVTGKKTIYEAAGGKLPPLPEEETAA